MLNRRSPSQDFKLPPHLFSASGNVDSVRNNRRSSISWEPRQSISLPSEDGRIPRARRSTADSATSEELRRWWRQTQHLRLHRDDSISPTAPESSRRQSYFLRPLEATYDPSQNSSKQKARPISEWLTSDPFSDHRGSSGKSTIRPNWQSDVIDWPPGTNNFNQQRTPTGPGIAFSNDTMHEERQRRGTVTSYIRRSSLWQTYEKAKKRGVELQRKKYVQIGFEYTIYAILVLFTYFVLVGEPLWNGAVYWLYWVVANKFVIAGGFGVTLGLALFYAFAPLLILFEKDPLPIYETDKPMQQRKVKDTALLIPCYKSAGLIAATLEAALKIFPPSHVFVIANGNSPVPLDDTEEICRPYGVNHVWSPIGSKIIAQFVGCYAAKAFKNVLLIDDDCALPEDFPVVTERLVGKVQCLGYTIKSVGPNSSKGNLCQQAQDLEYKLSGIQRAFAGIIGSATFPHGAISLWDRQTLANTFHEHPGFSVSEDWFFGHVARKLGCRIKMCTQVFVETETPKAVFFSSGGARGGFGEMTIFQQRFKRWNFFFVNGLWYNLAYVVGSWKLGWWEFGAKIFVLQEVYETLLYLFTPFILPISFYVRPGFCGILLASTIAMYFVNVVVFNEIHLRRKKERMGWTLLYIYYLPYKIILTGINVASCYWSLYKYARYFAKRHPKVVEDEKALAVVMRLEEEVYQGGRRMTVRAVNETENTGSADKSMHSVVAQPEPVHFRVHLPALEKACFEEEEECYDKRTIHFSRQRAIGKIEFGVRI